jgi:hypothetical protein
MFETTGSLSRNDLEEFLRERVPREMALCDLKTRLPNLDDDKERAEFIRDVIAMANAVRRIGHRGYLIFGISEPSIVVDQASTAVSSKTQASDIYKLMDQNSLHLLAVIERHIEPRVDAELFFCEVRGPVGPQATSNPSNEELKNLNHGIVAWLEFRYLHDGPFIVQRGVEYDEIKNDKCFKRVLKPGSAWTRFGASKGRELRGDDQRVLVAFRDVPYIDTGYWKTYAHQARPELPPFYQAVGGCVERAHAEKPERYHGLAIEYLDDWLGDAQTNLCLEGGIGSGKSTILRQFHSLLLKRLQMDVDGRKIHEPPQQWIPVWVDVNGESFAETTVVADLVLDRIADFGLPFNSEVGSRPAEWRRKILESPDLRYVIMFDGLDEMDESEVDWQKSLRSVRRFCESRRSQIRAILSARTGHYIWDRNRAGWDRLELQPLREEQARESAKRLLYPDAFMQAVFGLPDLKRYVVNPLGMNRLLSFADEFEEASRRRRSEIESSLTFSEMKSMEEESAPRYEVGQLVDILINAILEHESLKDIGQKRDLRRKKRITALAKLAWKLDGRDNLAPLAELERIFNEETLEEEELLRAKQMGILEDTISASEWGFASDLMKAYFLAQHAIGLAQSAHFQRLPGVDWDVALKGSVMTAPIWRMAGNLLVSLPLQAEAKRNLEPFIRRIGVQVSA